MENKKKRVLYISNIEVPYRVTFFNQLSKKCDLTVLYESKGLEGRNAEWAKSIKNEYKKIYLDDKCTTIMAECKKKYDFIIFGCFNTKKEAISILKMKLKHKKYYINIDGETFADDKGIKGLIKRFILKNATGYFVAGKNAALKIKKLFNTQNVWSYNFSSLTKKEIKENAEMSNYSREDYFLIVGQYEKYKGLDIALEVATKYPKIKFKFIGMNKKATLFKKLVSKRKANNVEVIPFLQKEQLKIEYKNCKCMLLPSRRECWGLVINEAASFGTPIISTNGSGAAIEFLSDKYGSFLAKSGDVDDMSNCITKFLEYKETKEFSKYLLKKSEEYSIEQNVKLLSDVINSIENRNN